MVGNPGLWFDFSYYKYNIYTCILQRVMGVVCQFRQITTTTTTSGSLHQSDSHTFL